MDGVIFLNYILQTKSTSQVAKATNCNITLCVGLFSHDYFTKRQFHLKISDMYLQGLRLIVSVYQKMMIFSFYLRCRDATNTEYEVILISPTVW